MTLYAVVIFLCVLTPSANAKAFSPVQNGTDASKNSSDDNNHHQPRTLGETGRVINLLILTRVLAKVPSANQAPKLAEKGSNVSRIAEMHSGDSGGVSVRQTLAVLAVVHLTLVPLVVCVIVFVTRSQKFPKPTVIHYLPVSQTFLL